MTATLALVVVVAGCLLACSTPSLCIPILGVPAYSFHDDDVRVESDGVEGGARASEGFEFAHLVVTTASPSSTPTPDDQVPLDSAKERSRFLVTMLMLESLHDKPFTVKGVADPKLKKQLLADEEVMQEVLKLYETQQETKGKHFIKIPPKLLKKMKLKMKELLSE